MNKNSSLKEAFIKVAYPNILFKDGTVDKKQVYRKIIEQVRERNLICAIILLSIQLFYLIKYLNEGFYIYNDFHLFHPVAQIIFAVSSILVIIYYFLTTKKEYDIMNRIVTLGYSVCILVAMFLWMICSIEHNPSNFCISFLYLIIFVLVPRIYFVDTLIIYFLTYVGIFLVTNIIVPEAIDVYQYYLIASAFLCISLYIRSNLIRTNVSIVNEKKLMKLLEMQNSIDPLTGALNRRALDNYLNDNFKMWKENNEYVALLMFDIDNFKEYNDTFSHIEGDECLKKVIEAIKGLTNDNMPHIFRYGGDEFAALIVGLDRFDVLNKALEILKTIKELKLKSYKKDETLTISIGCKMLSRIITSPVDFFTNADEELYNAKRKGKGCISFKKTIYK